jgi:hypothetical protein
MSKNDFEAMQRTLFAFADAGGHNRVNLNVEGEGMLLGVQLARGLGDDVIVAYRSTEQNPNLAEVIAIRSVISVKSLKPNLDVRVVGSLDPKTS